MWSDFNLKILEDPKKVYPTDKIEIISRKGFTTDKPELAAFYKNFKLDEKMLNELMADVSSDKNPEVGATLFYEKHKDAMSKWVVPKMRK